MIYYCSCMEGYNVNMEDPDVCDGMLSYCDCRAYAALA